MKTHTLIAWLLLIAAMVYLILHMNAVIFSNPLPK